MIEFNKRDIRTWSLLGPCGAHGAAAIELAGKKPNVLMITADLCFFSGLERFRAIYPDRIYNVGIAEQNMLGIAAGLAKEGFIPFANTYASFCTSRCADQVRVNMAYMRLPIKLPRVNVMSGRLERRDRSKAAGSRSRRRFRKSHQFVPKYWKSSEQRALTGKTDPRPLSSKL